MNSNPTNQKDAAPKIGSIIPFGKYEWLVLDVQGGEALITTKNIIEKRRYNEECTDVTWETCDLRKYLNSEFLREFTKEQQGQIAEKRIPNPDNLWYGTKGGSDTHDRIFLLSLEEADRYFGDSGDYLNRRREKHSGHGFSNGHDSDRVANRESAACGWRLRSPGHASYYAAIVIDDGSVFVYGDDVSATYHGGGVRPALWLHL